jgi:hypothetical protein
MPRRRKDYEVFVHLLDATTGARVAQVNSVPVDGTHPTRKWKAGEVVVDRIVLAMPALPPGTYRLEMGVRGANGGPRLPLSDERGKGQPPDRFMLPEVLEIR